MSSHLDLGQQRIKVSINAHSNLDEKMLLVVSLFIAHCKKHWFLIEPCRVNPYKLVYLVTKFAWQHKVPVNRSAFTYCEHQD